MTLEPRTVTILGSTGTIGQHTVELLLAAGDKFKTYAVTAASNVQLLANQAKALQAKTAVISTSGQYNELKQALAGTDIQALAGEDALEEVATHHGGIVMAAIVGAAALNPTLAAIRQGCTILLANKECFVCAGPLLQAEASKHQARIIPVDSEHNAIFQIFNSDQAHAVKKIILTSSGGPFLRASLEQLKNVTVEQALKHPKWQMGAKITIDSATMMNKGLELIEAFHLFPVTAAQIEVIVHPESIIHGMVEYIDGGVIAQLGTPDMRLPISLSLAWPERMASGAKSLSFAALGSLTFEAPDMEKFPSINLARNALQAGGTMPVILNAANEIAVSNFLERRVKFLDIFRIVEESLSKSSNCVVEGIEHVLAVDKATRVLAQGLIGKLG
ncbi:MAG: hypothetical protein RIT35_275 [Pseudomonadota bacterium]